MDGVSYFHGIPFAMFVSFAGNDLRGENDLVKFVRPSIE